MNYFKLAIMWFCCFGLSLLLLVETRPDNRVSVGTAIIAFVFAPALLVVGSVVYIGDNITVLDTCILGCNK